MSTQALPGRREQVGHPTSRPSRQGRLVPTVENEYPTLDVGAEMVHATRAPRRHSLRTGELPHGVDEPLTKVAHDRGTMAMAHPARGREDEV